MIDEPNGNQPEEFDVDLLREKPTYQGDPFAGLTQWQADALAKKFSQNVGAWRDEILSESQRAWEADRDNLFPPGTSTEDIQRVINMNARIDELKQNPTPKNQAEIQRLTREILPLLRKKAR